MLHEYAKWFDPNKPASLDDHLENLFYDSLARELEDDPGLQDYPTDVIAQEVMRRVNAVLEDRLSGEKLIRDYETWGANQVQIRSIPPTQ